MTNENAIEVLRTYDMSEDNEDKEFIEAVKMAISALKNNYNSAKINYKMQNSEIKVDLISRDEAVECCFNGWNKDFNEIAEDIKKLPTYPANLVKESDVLVKDGDLISRTELLNKIWRKEYGKDYDGVNMLGIPHIDIIENMPSYNSTKTELNGDLVKENTDLVKENTENADKKGVSEETVSQSLVKDGDLISRKAVLNLRKYNLVGGIHTVNVAEIENLPTYPMGIQTEVFESAIKCCGNVLDKMKDMSKEELQELARNTAEQKAEWIIHKDTIGVTNEILYIFECSGCGKCVTEQSRYCPNCGAKMKGDTE